VLRKLKEKLRRKTPEELISESEMFISEGFGEEIEPESEIEEEATITKPKRVNAEYLLSAAFFLNATIVSFLAGMIIRVAGIAGKYEQRIALINPDYLTYIDLAYYISIALLIYAVMNVFVAAYYFYEGRL